MPRIWKIAFREYAKPADVPEGAKPVVGARLEGFALDPMSRREALDMFRAIGGMLPMGADTGKKVIQDLVANRINDALRRGELVAFQRGGEASTGTQGSGSQTKPQKSTKAPQEVSKASGPPPDEPKPERTWFRAKLIDEDGEPCANEDYILVDSAGSKRTGKLDANGEVYIPPILPPGDCTIQFPNIHLNPRKRKSA